MTKTLTEKFMNNELDDRLYYFTQKMSQDNVEIGHSFEFNMVRADDGEYLDWFLINEVLAPVPSYDEYKRLQERNEKLEKMAFHYTPEEWNTMLRKVEHLQEQLNEANEVMKKYKTLEMGLRNNKGTLESVCPAWDYLERWGVK